LETENLAFVLLSGIESAKCLTGTHFAFLDSTQRFVDLVFVEPSTSMSKKVCITKFLVVVMCAASLSMAWASCSIPVLLNPFEAATQTGKPLTTSSDIDTTWRHTKFGWQDSATWTAADSFVPQKAVELIHPLVFAITILILVIAAMVWASNEWEIERLFGQGASVADKPESHKHDARS